ncbi:MAG: acyl-CoA desaturase [Phycisphaerales bacterium]|nr:acyl-CoA desaturase [Phycisphaerales bacterium]
MTHNIITDDVDDHALVAPSLVRRVFTLIAILVPLAGMILAMALLWERGFAWVELALFLGMYVATGLGITVGFHRLFAHKSFSCGPVVTATLGILGSMAVEGPLLRWVSFHRCHHQHSDDEGDPHSPHGYGGGFWGSIKGFWNAHIGWMFKPAALRINKYTPDLQRSKLVRRISLLFPLWVLVSMLVPTVLGGVISLSWSGALFGFLWGGLVRIAFVHHVTWSVNSICHLWGTRPYQSNDLSRNNFIVGVLAFGEGWHNNHHGFPTSARHGLKWWQPDLSWTVIWILSKLGLVWNVRLPSAERLAARRRAS